MINVDELKQEVNSLRRICERLERDLESARQQNKELAAKLENSEAMNAELHSRARFLEGQVEAYQYCMNCRR